VQATTSGEREDTFYNARIGGGLNYALANGDALDASLDYRFRYYDSDVRNDSDWRWRAAWSRAFGENNLAIGFRGRNSYRGESTFRNDYGIFSNYRYRLDPDNQITLGAAVWRRNYPNGRLRERSRSTVDASVGWVHSLLDGRATFTLTGHGGYNYATSRPDGNSAIYGATVNLDYAISDRLDGFIFGWYERDAFNTDRIHFHPDAIDETVILRRKDNLFEVGGGYVGKLRWERTEGVSFKLSKPLSPRCCSWPGAPSRGRRAIARPRTLGTTDTKALARCAHSRSGCAFS